MLTFWGGKQLAACAGRCNHYPLLGPPEEEGKPKV